MHVWLNHLLINTDKTFPFIQTHSFNHPFIFLINHSKLMKTNQ